MYLKLLSCFIRTLRTSKTDKNSFYYFTVLWVQIQIFYSVMGPNTNKPVKIAFNGLDLFLKILEDIKFKPTV